MILRSLRKVKGFVRLFLHKKYASFRKSMLGPYAVGIVYETQNGYLINTVQDVEIGRSLGFKGAYDISAIEFLKKYIQTKDSIYLIGSHIGALLIPLSKCCKQVYAYEANPDTFKLLNFNIALNGIQNVGTHNFAVGDSKRTIEFYSNSVNSGGSKMKPAKDHYYYNYDAPKTIQVPMLSLDAHVAQTKQEKPDGLIVDIEGSEYFALKGMQDALKHSHFLYIEYMPHHLDNVSQVSNAQFFELILPHYSKVIFMKDKTHPLVLKDSAAFMQKVDAMRAAQLSDDLLFLK